MFLQTYIDIHSHATIAEPQNNVLVLSNVYADFQSVSPERQYSFGIHPWYICNFEEEFDLLIKGASSENVKAIGECGLDRIKGAPFDIQLKAFERQIQLANELNKPLIIHCVRAFPETISLLAKANVQVIFHGFNKKMAIAKELLELGYYLSFGEGLLKEQSESFKVFADMPLNRIFLETDDGKMDIKDIYRAAAMIRKINEDAIILQIQENFKSVFNF